MKSEEEFVKLQTLCKIYDADRKTVEKVLKKLQESYSIETLNWNGHLRINALQFRRAILETASLNF